MSQCPILGFGKIILPKFPALNLTVENTGSGGMIAMIPPSNSSLFHPGWKLESLGFGSPDVPGLEHLVVRSWVSPDVCNLDSDGTVIGLARMPCAFFEIEGLVDGSIHIEHKMDRETAKVLENLETLTGSSTDIVVQNKLTYLPGKIRNAESVLGHFGF
jgi:hypothetical protein